MGKVKRKERHQARERLITALLEAALAPKILTAAPSLRLARSRRETLRRQLLTLFFLEAVGLRVLLMRPQRTRSVHARQRGALSVVAQALRVFARFLQNNEPHLTARLGTSRGKNNL